MHARRERPREQAGERPVTRVRRQNMPSRKVAKSGAFTNANTNCSMSMMLLKRVATYAVATDSAMPADRGRRVPWSDSAHHWPPAGCRL